MGTNTKAADKALLAKVSGELDAAEAAMDDHDLMLAETLLENAGEHLAAAGADPTARTSYRPPAAGAGSDSSGGDPTAAEGLIGADEMTRFDFLQLKLAFRTRRVPAAVALTRLVRLLQQNKDVKGGRELYTEMSKAAYASRASSLSHSHPPPATKSRGGESEGNR